MKQPELVDVGVERGDINSAGVAAVVSERYPTSVVSLHLRV